MVLASASVIEIRIREVAERRGIKNAYGLRKLLNISPSVAARLWSGEFANISVTTLDRLCTALRCKASDLFRHSSDEKT